MKFPMQDLNFSDDQLSEWIFIQLHLSFNVTDGASARNEYFRLSELVIADSLWFHCILLESKFVAFGMFSFLGGQLYTNIHFYSCHGSGIKWWRTGRSFTSQGCIFQVKDRWEKEKGLDSMSATKITSLKKAKENRGRRPELQLRIFSFSSWKPKMRSQVLRMAVRKGGRKRGEIHANDYFNGEGSSEYF